MVVRRGRFRSRLFPFPGRRGVPWRRRRSRLFRFILGVNVFGRVVRRIGRLGRWVVLWCRWGCRLGRGVSCRFRRLIIVRRLGLTRGRRVWLRCRRTRRVRRMALRRGRGSRRLRLGIVRGMWRLVPWGRRLLRLDGGRRVPRGRLRRLAFTFVRRTWFARRMLVGRSLGLGGGRGSWCRWYRL